MSSARHEPDCSLQPEMLAQIPLDFEIFGSAEGVHGSSVVVSEESEPAPEPTPCPVSLTESEVAERAP
jgi:hypothetical protein